LTFNIQINDFFFLNGVLILVDIVKIFMRVCFPFGSFCFVLFGSAFGFL